MAIVDADIDPLALERQVCFALAVTNRAVLAVYRPLLEPLGLTHPQYLVMLALWDHHKSNADRALSVKAIATALQLDSATLSPMLKRLEALGLITRTRSAADERATDVGLTKAGIQLRRRALKIPPAVVARLGVGLDELERLHDVLTRVNAAALAAGALDEGKGIPMTPMKKPGPLQFVAYAYGKRLPDSMKEWVAHDLADNGAVRRHMLRMAIPPLLVLAPLWLLPASLYVHLEMTAPIYIWAILMALALNKVWRRHRLAQHGLDPNLVDQIKRKRDAAMHEAYARKYGPRPEEARWQSNSSPF